MQRTALATLGALALSAAAAAAAEPAIGDTLGTEPGAIAAALAERDYHMTRFVAGGERIDVTAIKEGRRLDLVLDASTGEVVGPQAGLRRSGLDDASIRELIAAEGYRITKYEREGREIEVYATRDGRRWELEVDRATGEILRAEEES